MGHRVTKVRGFTLSGEILETLNVRLMRKYVYYLQQGKPISTDIPQIRLKIDVVTKQITAREYKAAHTNYSNHKRFYEPSASKNRLWPFGVTHYEE